MRNKKNPVVLGLTVTVTALLSDTADCHCSVSVVFYLLLWMFVDIKQQVCISLRTTKRHRNVIAWCVALSVVLMQLSDRALAVTVLCAEIQSFFFQFLLCFLSHNYLKRTPNCEMLLRQNRILPISRPGQFLSAISSMCHGRVSDLSTKFARVLWALVAVSVPRGGHVGDKSASLLLTVIFCFLWDFPLTLYRHFIFSFAVELCHHVCCRGITAHLEKLAILK